jgi:hypothetical protein
MIIKLIPVKRTGALGGIAKYIAQDKSRIEDYRHQSIFHNLLRTELPGMTQEFRENYNDFARQRQNGNVAMHVILSVSPLDRDKMTVEKMDDLVRTYIERAYPNALAFGAHHRSQEHWHSHLLVSANELASSKSTRLSKQQLREVQAHMLEHIREKHPELTVGVEMKNWGRRLHSEKEYYKVKRNPDLKLTKDELGERVQGIFRVSESSKDFYRQLETAGFSTYLYKDRVQGIRFGEDSRKLRFARLGVEHENIAALDKQYERLQDLEAVRSSSRSERDLDTERGLSRDRFHDSGREAGNNSRGNEPDDRDNASDDDDSK